MQSYSGAIWGAVVALLILRWTALPDLSYWVAFSPLLGGAALLFILAALAGIVGLINKGGDGRRNR